MALGLSATTANALLNAVLRGTAYTPPSAIYAKLHVGEPGSAGTANAATETTRKQITFGTVASGGAISNTVAASWTSVAGTEDYTHVSLWDAVSGGNYLMSGAITAAPVAAGDDFSLAIGEIDIALGTAS